MATIKQPAPIVSPPRPAPPVARPPRPAFPRGADRFERWTAAMKQLGYVLEKVDQVPPPDGQPYVAIVAAGASSHALGLIGLTVLDSTEPERTIRPDAVLTACRFTAAA